MRKLLLLLVSGSFIAFQTISCGGDDNNNIITLLISPEGPTIVKRDATLQFTANTEVTWSVAGGDSRGTIDAAGLYTPPATIPVDSPAVSILAETADGQSAEAFVDLRAADVLSFSEALPVNDTVIPFSAVLGTILIAPLADRIGVTRGSVRVDSVWGIDDGGIGVTAFSQSVAFGAFSPEQPITDTAQNNFPMSLETDLQNNPQLLALTEDVSSRAVFMSSDDGGASFGEPVPISTANPDDIHQGGNLRIDGQGDLHVLLTETDTSVLDGPTNVFYSRSDDEGGTWSPLLPLSDAVDDSLEVLFPSLGVSGDGQSVVACWTQNDNIFYAFSSDGGANFNDAQALTSANENEICRVAVGPEGRFYITYSEILNTDGVNIVLRTSTDGGQTFGSPFFVNGSTPETGEAVTTIAVDSLGRIDVVWISDPSGASDTGDLVHSRSIDGGVTFSPKVTVFDATELEQVGFPSGIRHDEADRLYLQYYDINANIDGNIFLLHGE